MIAIAYLKQKCSFSRGVREVLAKYGIEYEERQIHIPEYFKEMVVLGCFGCTIDFCLYGFHISEMLCNMGIKIL